MIILGAFASLFPFVWMLILSSRENKEIFEVPPSLRFGDQLWTNIKAVIEGTPFFRSFLNTLFVATVQTLLMLFLATLAGFAFAKLKFKGREILFTILIGTMMIPTQMNTIPQYFIMDRLGWVGSYKALIIPSMVSAFSIFWVKQFAEEGISDSLIEAARIDGATTFQILTRVAVPIIRPGLAFLTLYSFMGSWNEYMWPLIVLKDESKYTLQLALSQLKGLYTVNYSLVLTGSFLSVIPLIILFAVFSKQLIAGITEGAVKG